MFVLVVGFMLLASLLLSVYMIIVTLERCRSEKRYIFVYFIAALLFYTLGYFIEISCGNELGAIIGVKIEYIGGLLLAPLFFFFAAEYCEIRIPKNYYRIPILIIPVLYYILVATFDLHHLVYLDYHYEPENPILGLVITPGPLYLIGQLYPFFCMFLTCIILIRRIVSRGKGQRFALVLLLISSVAPLISIVPTFLTGLNFTAFVTVISNFIYYYNVIRKDMFDIAPKAHAITLDLIRDAFVVLDRDLAYTGSNKNAEELFPGLSRLQKGTSIQGLENWPEELLATRDGKEEIEFTLPHRPGKNYSGWMNRITSAPGVTLGWVILIQDVTETVRLTASLKFFNDQLHKAFSTYLSEDVVKEIIVDPTRLQLGGIKRHMTAMFTDIQNFSKLAEALSPEKLVELLNHYLSAMSDIILDQKGTIDKYEGDAILAFFGAPQKLPDHALRTCTAAILMKRLEAEVNKLLLEKDLSPHPIFTRIGINTDEMVVGNMGTQKKMNYTVMGNAVNLAARLEGVNKQYGTSIIASENTINETGGKILSRRIGWIRVVGISKPVRIYEILELKKDANPSLHKLVELFHSALDFFESRKWKKAESAFSLVLKAFPNDNPSKHYLKVCRKYIKNPPPKNWDGVFNISRK